MEVGRRGSGETLVVRATEARNYTETKRFTKIRESIEVGRELHSDSSQPRRACKNVLNTDSETAITAAAAATTTIIIIITLAIERRPESRD